MGNCMSPAQEAERTGAEVLDLQDQLARLPAKRHLANTTVLSRRKTEEAKHTRRRNEEEARHAQELELIRRAHEQELRRLDLRDPNIRTTIQRLAATPAFARFVRTHPELFRAPH